MVKNLGAIGVIAGGDSPEREVSLTSGHQVYAALEKLGYRAKRIDIESLDDLVPGLRGIDVAFNCLHGGSGENGVVQLLLDVLGIPYAGSGPLASALAMDKPRAKAVLVAQGVCPSGPGPAGATTGKDRDPAGVYVSLGDRSQTPLCRFVGAGGRRCRWANRSRSRARHAVVHPSD